MKTNIAIMSAREIVDSYDLVIGYDETERKPDMDKLVLNENGLFEGDYLLMSCQEIADKIDCRKWNIINGDVVKIMLYNEK